MAPKSAKPALPTSFTLAGFEWTVAVRADLSEYGRCDPTTQTIFIREGLNEQMTQQTFFHELVHAIMFAMGKTVHDEEFTDIFGSFLHQYDKTKS
jgi:Zn-dependent peptidase ImmA (M78 family)